MPTAGDDNVVPLAANGENLPLGKQRLDPRGNEGWGQYDVGRVAARTRP